MTSLGKHAKHRPTKRICSCWCKPGQLSTMSGPHTRRASYVGGGSRWAWNTEYHALLSELRGQSNGVARGTVYRRIQALLQVRVLAAVARSQGRAQHKSRRRHGRLTSSRMLKLSCKRRCCHGKSDRFRAWMTCPRGRQAAHVWYLSRATHRCDLRGVMICSLGPPFTCDAVCGRSSQWHTQMPTQRMQSCWQLKYEQWWRCKMPPAQTIY